MTSWKDIHPNFTSELQREWESKGFGCEECKEWWNAGMKVVDADSCAWLRDRKKLIGEILKKSLESYNKHQKQSTFG